MVYPNGDLSACEMRKSKINMAAFDYDLKKALASETIKKERGQIQEGKCHCVHGCWLLVSMFDHYDKFGGWG